jgi:hypothetical protein
LDASRAVTDIPESVSDLLVPSSRRHAFAQQELPPAIEPEATAAKKPAGTKAKTAGARLALPPDADGTGGPTRVAAEHNAVIGQQDQAVPSATDPAIRQTVDNDVSFSAGRQQLFASASVTQIIKEPRRLTSATSLDDLLGIEPTAEALIKTLAGKARTCRLDEMKALELLQQAVLL